ncbi:MAG: hypothetical protein J0L66_15935 [Cytophagales bacterium]|nr:hypothetical protein [Cytophagales bacterium]
MEFSDGKNGVVKVNVSSNYSIGTNGDTLYLLDGTYERSGYYDVSESQREYYFQRYVGLNGILTDYYDSLNSEGPDLSYFKVTSGKLLDEKYYPQFAKLKNQEKEIISRTLPYFIRDEYKGQDTIKVADKIKIVMSLGLPTGIWSNFGNNMNEHYFDSIQFDKGEPIGKWVIRTAPVSLDKVTFMGSRVKQIETYDGWHSGRPSTNSASFKLKWIVFPSDGGVVTDYYDDYGRIGKRRAEDGNGKLVSVQEYDYRRKSITEFEYDKALNEINRTTRPLANESRNESSETDDLLNLSVLKSSLLRASINKCKNELGSPDIDGMIREFDDGNVYAWIYLNREVRSESKRKQHLIVFIKALGHGRGVVEDIQSIDDNEKAYYDFGSLYVGIQNRGKDIQSNSRAFHATVQRN